MQAAVDEAAAGDGGAAHRRLLRGHRLGRARSPRARGPHPLRAVRDGHGGHQPVGTFNVLRLAARRDDRQHRAGRRGRARRARQHRLGRGVRRPDRPDRLLGVEGRRRRHDAAGRARPRRSAASASCTIAPGLFDTPLLAGAARGGARRARRPGPVPAAARPPGGVRRSSPCTSSRTRCSTARRSGSTARCGWRRARPVRRAAAATPPGGRRAGPSASARRARRRAR